VSFDDALCGNGDGAEIKGDDGEIREEESLEAIYN